MNDPTLLCDFETLVGNLVVFDIASDGDVPVMFRLFNDCSYVRVRAFLGGRPSLDDYDRVIEFPLEVTTGKVCIQEPTDHPEPVLSVVPGSYNVIFALKDLGEHADENFGLESVDFYFNMTTSPLDGARLVLAEPGFDADSYPCFRR